MIKEAASFNLRKYCEIMNHSIAILLSIVKYNANILEENTMKMKYFISWIIATIFFTNIISAQEGVAVDSTKIKGYSGKFLSDKTNNVFLQRAKITPQLEEELKTINLDVRGYLSLHKNKDERSEAALFDLVFIGKVLNIIDTPNPKSDLFHSKVNIQVLEVLRGPKQERDTIQLLRRSGSITDSPESLNLPSGIIPSGKLLTTNFSIDATYKIGDTSVFFAYRFEDHPIWISSWCDQSTLSKEVLKYPNPSYYVSNSGKFEIVNSMIEFYDRTIPLEQFKEEIKQVAKIVDQH